MESSWLMHIARASLTPHDDVNNAAARGASL